MRQGQSVQAGGVEWSAVQLQLGHFWQHGMSALFRSLPPRCHHRLCLRDLPTVPEYREGCFPWQAGKSQWPELKSFWPTLGHHEEVLPERVVRLWRPCPDSAALGPVPWHGWAALGTPGAWECGSGHSPRQWARWGEPPPAPVRGTQVSWGDVSPAGPGLD